MRVSNIWVCFSNWYSCSSWLEQCLDTWNMIQYSTSVIIDVWNCWSRCVLNYNTYYNYFKFFLRTDKNIFTRDVFFFGKCETLALEKSSLCQRNFSIKVWTGVVGHQFLGSHIFKETLVGLYGLSSAHLDTGWDWGRKKNASHVSTKCTFPHFFVYTRHWFANW